MIKNVAKLMILLVCIVSLVFWLLGLGTEYILTYSIVSGFLLLNLLTLFILWRAIILKKSIAQGLSIIIFKYPIIAYILWTISKSSWIKPTAILVAILTFVISIVGATLYNHFLQRSSIKE